MNQYIDPPSTLPPASRVWTYLRDSGGPTQGESIERQLEEIKGYCTRHGLILEKTYIDTARSGGSTSGRERFDDLIRESAEPDHATGLLLWDFARFSRSLDDSGYYKAILRKNGVVIHSITDAVPEGNYSRVVEVIIDIANEEKRRQVSRDTASGLRRIVEQYGAMPGPVPTGYKKEPVDAGLRRDGSPHILHRWIVDPEKAPLIQRAFEMRAAGKTIRQIREATHLFQSKNSYATFFNNTVYKGEMYFSGKYYPCPAIVTSEIWEAAQKMGGLRSRDRYDPQRGRRGKTNYLLSGLLICQECGAPLMGYKLLKNQVYYVCTRARRRHDCSARHIPSRSLENGIVEKIKTEILNVDNLMRVQAQYAEEKKRRIQEQELSRQQRLVDLGTVKKKIDRYLAAIGESGHTRALLSALEAAEKERDEHERQLEQTAPEIVPQEYTRAELQTIADELIQKLDGDDFDEKRNAMLEIVARILVTRFDDDIYAVIEYYPLKTNTSRHPGGGGGISASDCGPEGKQSLALTIEIRHIHLKRT
jgi:site-specific DNA recombinase